MKKRTPQDKVMTDEIMIENFDQIEYAINLLDERVVKLESIIEEQAKLIKQLSKVANNGSTTPNKAAESTHPNDKDFRHPKLKEPQMKHLTAVIKKLFTKKTKQFTDLYEISDILYQKGGIEFYFNKTDVNKALKDLLNVELHPELSARTTVNWKGSVRSTTTYQLVAK